jgi:hypothetical protein
VNFYELSGAIYSPALISSDALIASASTVNVPPFDVHLIDAIPFLNGSFGRWLSRLRLFQGRTRFIACLGRQTRAAAAVGLDRRGSGRCDPRP